jgi:hypothetical protein
MSGNISNYRSIPNADKTSPIGLLFTENLVLIG